MRSRALIRWQLFTALASGVAAVLLAVLLWRIYWVEPDVRELLSDRLGQEVARARHWPEECIKLRAPPDGASHFLSGVRNDGMPIVFRRAQDIFGKALYRWRNVSYLEETHGAAVFNASYFDTSDPQERFGIMPVEGGRYLQKPHLRERTLREVLHFDRPDRLLVFEQACFQCPEEEEVRKVRAQRASATAASGAEAPGLDRSGQQHDVEAIAAGHRLMFEEWQAPSFLGDLVVRQVNLWLGRLPVGENARPKESPTHFDEGDNLMLQIRGSKVFWLFDASDAPNLHPKIMQARIKGNPDLPGGKGPGEIANFSQDNFSPVDPAKPGADGLPRSHLAAPMRCELHPGEALYMPGFTWHQVMNYGEASSDPAENGLNIGVNVWFESDSRFKFLFESVMAVLRGRNIQSSDGPRPGSELRGEDMILEHLET